MSTILDALQKQTSHQTNREAYGIKSNYWNIALFISSLVIIILLATLIYILLNPASYSQLDAQAVVDIPANTMVQKYPVEPLIEKNKPEVKAITKVLYLRNLKPLPENKLISKAPEEIQIDQPTQVALSANSAVSDEKRDNIVSKEQLVLSGESQPLLAESQIDYSNVSDELKDRFQYALLTNREEGKAIIESENSDGSDIHQMATSFQKKVPAFSYDFHVYSTLLEERWIRINGEDLREGEFDSSGKIEVVEIQPERTFFRCEGQSFSVQSLTNWNGFSHQ